jgi:Surface antigen variable number repeat
MACFRHLREMAYNPRMRSRAVHIAGLLAICLLLVTPRLTAQSVPSAAESHPPNLKLRGKQPSEPEVWIDNVTFSGFLQLPVSDQEEIAATVRNKSHGPLLDGVVEEALERIRAGWQDRGYFKVQARGEAKEISRTSTEIHTGLFAQIDEHQRYTLREITFKHAKHHAEMNDDFMRSRFLIKDGEVFRDKIAKGLENLRKVYGEMGYLNYTGVPSTRFDDKKGTISVVVDLDSGKQFYISSINVLGRDDTSRQVLLRDFPLMAGQIYNQRLWELGLQRQGSMLPILECHSQQAIKMDEQSGTVELTLDFRPCNGPSLQTPSSSTVSSGNEQMQG